jgi:hypothetical protein
MLGSLVTVVTFVTFVTSVTTRDGVVKRFSSIGLLNGKFSTAEVGGMESSEISRRRKDRVSIAN